jgi:hypothetical protein
MDFVCTFLDNDEDTLPELFDPKSVPQLKSDQCALCLTSFSGKMNLLGAGKDK